ncbi:MAG TPA: hypothetical protein VNO14_06535, partial [Blastocatellia bacterium]|nr:hypothetical protein [Blastocatellia bacterium]
MKRTATTRPVKAALALPLFIALVVLPAISRAGSARPPDKGYYVYVVCESVDKVAVVSFGPRGARLERQLDIGAMPTDIDGPHSIV